MGDGGGAERYIGVWEREEGQKGSWGQVRKEGKRKGSC